MKDVTKEEKALNSCLTMVLANRLAFESKQAFADYSGYPALMSNSPVSKMPYNAKLKLAGRLKDDFLYPGTGL